MTVGRNWQIEEFLDAAGWAGATRIDLAQDASFRRYERIFLDGKLAVLMDAPPDKAALELIRALKALANRPSNPSLAAGMKSPVEFMVEPDYPEMEAKKGGCCLVS